MIANRTSPRAWALFAWLALFLVTIVSPARAQPAPPAPTAQDQATYKRHLDTAKKLVASQAYDVAAGELEAAYAVVPNPDALRQALDCYKQMHAAAKQSITAKRLLATPKALKFGEKKTLEALVASLAGSVGTMVLTVSEAGADVQLDGQDLGPSPIKPQDLDVGPHKLHVTKAGFENADRDVAVVAQSTVTVNLAMEPEIKTGKVTVTEKSGAAIDVLVDGNVVGQTPWTGDVALGPHQVSGHSATMDAPAQPITVVKHQATAVTLAATATTGKLEIETADGKGIIYVDDKVVGEGKASVDLPVGTHAVAIKREGYVNAERNVEVTSGGSTSLKVALERLAPQGPVPRSYDVYEGIYGGLMFAGLVQAGSTGNQLQRRCSDIGGPCTLDTEKGGGVYGYLGYTWRPVGVDLFLGGSGDVSSPSVQVPGGSDSWDISRVGGLGAIRVRSQVQTHVVRASLAVGLGVAERVLMIPNHSTDYTSLVGTFDAAFALRTSATSAIAFGCMGFWEDAGQGAVVDVPQSRTPFYLFSGPQYLIEPYLGLQFGP